MLEDGAPTVHSPKEYIETSINDENMENVQLIENPEMTLLQNDIEISSHENDTRKKRLCKGKKKYVQFIIFFASCVIYIHIY